MWRESILVIPLVLVLGCQQAADQESPLDARIAALEATVEELAQQLEALETKNEGQATPDKTIADETAGMADFTPSRLEWLVVNVALKNKTTNIDKDGYQLILALREPDTLVISALYAPEKVEPDVVDQAVLIATTDANALAAKHGWDAWLKVEEKLVPQFGPL